MNKVTQTTSSVRALSLMVLNSYFMEHDWKWWETQSLRGKLLWIREGWIDVTAWMQHRYTPPSFKLSYITFQTTPLLLLCSWSTDQLLSVPSDAGVSVPLSLHCLLIGSATRVLGLHHVGQFRGTREGLDVQLLEHVIWGGEGTKTHELRDNSTVEIKTEKPSSIFQV